MEPEISSLCSPKPAIRPHPQLDNPVRASHPIYLLYNFSILLLLLPLRLKYLPQNPPFSFALNVRTKVASTENNNQHYVSVYCDRCYVGYLTKKTKLLDRMTAGILRI